MVWPQFSLDMPATDSDEEKDEDWVQPSPKWFRVKGSGFLVESGRAALDTKPEPSTPNPKALART